MWYIKLRPCSLKPPSSCGFERFRTPFLIGISITSGLAFFGFFLNGNYLFSGQRRQDNPTPTPSLSARPKKAPQKVPRRTQELHLRIRRWVKVGSSKLCQMGLGFSASPNKSRQIRVANYISLITPRYLRLASYVIRLAFKAPSICLGSCTSPLGLLFCI